MRKVTMFVAAVALLTASCAHTDLGTGLNTVTRGFMLPLENVWEASVDCVEDAGLVVESANRDALSGEIIARRSNGKEVLVHVKRVDERHTLVSVRVDEGDVRLATLLHERIAAELGLGEAESGLFGGASEEGTFQADLNKCVIAAQRTCAALDLIITHEERHGEWAGVDARTDDSTPVRIRIEREGDLKCAVDFIAGTSRTDDTRDLAKRMKGAFEDALRHIE